MDKFPKKYNFKVREGYWKRYWAKEGVYKFEEISKKSIYSIDTPPPYVSAAHLHQGHIMSYSQAEFVARYKRMAGYNVFYPMGFDDNGLPTERYVETKYKVDKSKVSRKEFIKLCLKETKVGAETYKELWTNLGISVDWSRTYSTINSLCQRTSQWSFIDLYKKGIAYQGEDPVLWCPHCATAVAQADLEDKDSSVSLNFINFQIEGKDYPVATTRPELIPACVAVFANSKDKRYRDLKDKKATIPLFNYEVPIYFDSAVDVSFGTGLMMVCSWGDVEDVRKYKENQLNTRQVIDESGKLNNLAGEYEGLEIHSARKKIVQRLRSDGILFKQEKVDHSVNTHERCGTPVEFILKKQWFIKILDAKKDLLRLGRELEWYPKFMHNRYTSWVKGLRWDWCISRQRYYGVPIPVWYCEKCGSTTLPKESDLPVDPREEKPPIMKCSKCNSTKFIPEMDVMDTWATSSCTPFIIPELVKKTSVKRNIFPNTLRPQAFEIIRTWLFYSVVKSFYHYKKLPFKQVMISGHGLDEKGRKLSKRLGNYVDPDKLISDYGADAIRYWATGATLGQNHRFSIKEVDKGKRIVNKIWNASRFCAMSLAGYAPKSDRKYELEPEDKWILHKLNSVIKNATKSFEKYEYAKVRTALDKFFWGVFCDYYLEMVKHRAEDVAAKNSLYLSLNGILKLYAPILPFITEEIYSILFGLYEKQNSIHATSWPKVNASWEMDNKKLLEVEEFINEIDNIRKIRSDKKMNFGEKIENYQLKTKVDPNVFGEKLEMMMNVGLAK